MATSGLQMLPGQFVNMAIALNIGLAPQGNGSWFIPGATPPVNQGVLCGGPSLLATPTFAPRGILVQTPRPYTQIDAIATAFQNNLNDGVKIAAGTKMPRRALNMVNGWYERARGLDKDVELDAPKDPLVDPDNLRMRAEMALFDCLKGVGICAVFRQQEIFNPTMIREGVAIATGLQKLLNPNSTALALLAELDAEALSLESPGRGSGEDRASEYRRSAMLKAGLAWKSFTAYLTKAGDAPADLFEGAVYRGAYHMYAAGAYGELSELYQIASDHYRQRDEERNTGIYALRAAWAGSNRPEEARDPAMKQIGLMYFDRVLPNLAVLSPKDMDGPGVQNVGGIISELSNQLRPPKGGGDVPHD